MIVLDIGAAGNKPEWGPGCVEEIARMAAEFKAADDKIGLYLCALAEECAAKAKEGGTCTIEAYFFGRLAVFASMKGGLHSAVHAMYPALNDMIEHARYRARIADLEQDEVE